MAAAKARNRHAEPQFSLTNLLGGAAALVLAHPRLVAGTVAFVTVFSFFAGNALHYQSQQHPRALFSTRTLAFDPSDTVRQDPLMTATATPRPETRIVFEREGASQTTAAATPAPIGDPTVAQVQKTLTQLGLYAGDVDGLTGPRTAEAVRRYQGIVGLPETGEVDAALLEELTQTPAIVSAIPTPRPRHGTPETVAQPVAQQVAAAEPEPVNMAAGSGEAVRIARIQAGLRAFGHDQIEIDGIAGSQTREAIAEFQALFRLAATGQPDTETEAKMREIGLIN